MRRAVSIEMGLPVVLVASCWPTANDHTLASLVEDLGDGGVHAGAVVRVEERDSDEERVELSRSPLESTSQLRKSSLAFVPLSADSGRPLKKPMTCGRPWTGCASTGGPEGVCCFLVALRLFPLSACVGQMVGGMASPSPGTNLW